MSRKTRKLIWSVPLVAAIAVVGALALFMTLDPTEVAAQADQPPGQVGTVSAAAYNEGVPEEEIELTWEAPTTGGLASYYRIDISTNGGFTWVALEDDVRNTRYLHEDLSAGQMFHYRVFARNTNGISPVSNIAGTSTKEASPPARPTNLNAIIVVGDALSDDQATTTAELIITLTWDPPLDPPGAPVLGYMVEYSDDGSRWIALKTVGNVVTTTHPELDAGVEYHYRVAAYNKTMKNSDDEDVPDPRFTSGWSNTDTDTTLQGALPGQPTPLEPGVSPSVPGVWLYWTPPTNTDSDLTEDPIGDPIAGYEVEGRPTSQFNAAEPPVLEPCPDADDQCPFQVIKTDIDRPSGTEINSFQVTVRDVDVNTTYDASFTEEFPWAYRIRAINRRANSEASIAAGNDEAADAAQELIDPTYSADIVVLARTPTTLRRPENIIITRSEADNSGRTGLLLKWNRAETLPYDEDGVANTVDTVSFALAYRIEYSDDGPPDAGYDWKLLEADHGAVEGIQQTFTDNHLILDIDATTETANDLRAGQERHYRVFALTAASAASADMSWPSEQKSGTTAPPLVPKKPTSLTARASGHTSIDLIWVAPDVPADDLDGSEEGTSVIKGYFIEYSDNEGRTWNALVTEDNGSAKVVGGIKHTDEGLMPGQTRDYQVAAVNMAGRRNQSSTWSNSASAKTEPAPLPNEPGGLVAEADGQNAIKLCWNAQAEEAEDAPVTSYLIEYSPDGKDGTWMDLTSVADMTYDSVHTVYRDTMDLNGDTTRHYRVSAVNVRGPSDQSDVAMATTGPATVPDAPMASAMATSDTEITVTWGSPASDGGADITGYMVQRAYMGADNMMSEWMDVDPAHMGMDMMYMDTGLMSETKYYYRVAAMNSVGMGEYSDGMTMATTEATDTAPGVPTAVTAMETSDTEITVTWGSPASDGGADITGYMVQRAYMGADNMMSEWMDVDPAHMGMDMMYMDTGLMSETKYYYRVAAMNSVGMGEYSDGMTMATTEATDTTLGEPSMVAATSSGGTITVNWMPGANAASQVIVAVNESDDTDYCLHVDTSGMLAEHECPNLTAGQTYVVLIIALDGQGGFELGNVVSHTAN